MTPRKSSLTLSSVKKTLGSFTANSDTGRQTGCTEGRKTSSSNSLPGGKGLSQEKQNCFFPAVKEAIAVLQSTPCLFPHPLTTISGEEDFQLVSNSHSTSTAKTAAYPAWNLLQYYLFTASHESPGKHSHSWGSPSEQGGLTPPAATHQQHALLFRSCLPALC